MHPIQIIALLHGATKAPGAIKNWWNSPPRHELERRNAEIRSNLEKGERARALKSALVSREANAAYEKGMRCWKGGIFARPNKEEARKWIRTAALGGHLDAQMMARMHGIDF